MCIYLCNFPSNVTIFYDIAEKKLISSVQDTIRKEAIDPPQRYQNQNDPVPKLLLRCMERSRDPLVLGGNTTRYQCLAFGTGWCYHPVLMDPFTLVPGENITRYLCLAFGTGLCLPPGTKSASQVTSKGKYLRFSHNCVVDEVVKEIHLRQEVTGSNPSHCNVLLFSFDAVQRYPKVPGHSPGING